MDRIDLRNLAELQNRKTLDERYEIYLDYSDMLAKGEIEKSYLYMTLILLDDENLSGGYLEEFIYAHNAEREEIEI